MCNNYRFREIDLIFWKWACCSDWMTQLQNLPFVKVEAVSFSEVVVWHLIGLKIKTNQQAQSMQRQ